MDNACAVVSVEVCGLKSVDTGKARTSASAETGIPAENILVAATHTHSGPAAMGFFNPREEEYLDELLKNISLAIQNAAQSMRPVVAGCASGYESTISHYRRLCADDGHVVMNWEPYPPEKIKGPLGEIDPEVGVVKIAEAEHPENTVCILFNHAGHPNVMSGDNYLISGDYPGLAMRLLEKKYGGVALFVNGAQGTMDIDGLRDRDWEGVERTGNALAAAVSETALGITLHRSVRLRSGTVKYSLPPRKISIKELAWAEHILENTGGEVHARPDGVGDDYKALLFKKLHDNESRKIDVDHTCIALDDTALISFPGELFTEIGMRIKGESPFARTLIAGLTNGEIGYVPTRKAIGEGGYAVETREAGDDAEDIVISQCLALLEKTYKM